MNWQIRDEIVIDKDIADNSTNNARSTDYSNEERKLARTWETPYSYTRSSWVNVKCH